jgi:DNA polymerase III delta subunit
MRALGIISDKDIIRTCLLDLDKNSSYIDYFIPSVHDANKIFTQQTALEFIADQVEGNLIAAHQEILKLGLLYPVGKLTEEQIRSSILKVARYNVFELTEAMLAGDLPRLNRMLDGLKGEGEPLVLILWSVTE